MEATKNSEGKRPVHLKILPEKNQQMSTYVEMNLGIG